MSSQIGVVPFLITNLSKVKLSSLYSSAASFLISINSLSYSCTGCELCEGIMAKGPRSHNRLFITKI